MYHEKMFDEKFTRASSPDVLFNISSDTLRTSIRSLSASQVCFHIIAIIVAIVTMK